MGSKIIRIPKLDLSLLGPEKTPAWDAQQGEVLRALKSYGCVEVAYDRVTPELRDALFGRAWPELFGLPLEVKLLAKSDMYGHGYTGQFPGWPYESIVVPDDVDKFALKFWPQGNLTFCDTVSTFVSHMKDLEQIVLRMLFIGLGIEKYYDSYTKSRVHETLSAEYGAPLGQESMTGLSEHVDSSIISIICQQRGGLEVQTTGGEWIPVVPSPNSFTVIIGEPIQVWTNGRLQAPLHRVRITGNGKRYSSVFASTASDDFVVQTPGELVDEEHPLIYKPYVFKDHKLYRYSDGAARINNTLYDFCGIRDEERK